MDEMKKMQTEFEEAVDCIIAGDKVPQTPTIKEEEAVDCIIEGDKVSPTPTIKEEEVVDCIIEGDKMPPTPTINEDDISTSSSASTHVNSNDPDKRVHPGPPGNPFKLQSSVRKKKHNDSAKGAMAVSYILNSS